MSIICHKPNIPTNQTILWVHLIDLCLKTIIPQNTNNPMNSRRKCSHIARSNPFIIFFLTSYLAIHNNFLLTQLILKFISTSNFFAINIYLLIKLKLNHLFSINNL